MTYEPVYPKPHPGEPAFPSPDVGEPGMFLRDYFATHAPAPAQDSLLNIHPEPRPVRPTDPSQMMAWHLAVGQWEVEARAMWNYRYADAMLAARGK